MSASSPEGGPRSGAGAGPPVPGPGRVALGPGGEFDLIRSFLTLDAGEGRLVRVGPGDDAAVLEGGWVLSTDLSVEDVHFRRGWIGDDEVGYRAAAAALSDLAAMAAEPVAVLVSMAIPEGGAVDALAVQSGVREAARAVGAAVVGGDLSRSPGPLFLDVTVVGRSEAPVLRAGARPGDEVWVTGALGGAGAAVRLWRAGRQPGPALRAAFARPVPRVAAARALARAGVVRAMVDLSDGLAGDAAHLAAAAGARVVLRSDLVPVHPAAREALSRAEALEAALSGGEDYELCFAAPPGLVSGGGALVEEVGVPLTLVGRVEAGEGVWLDAGDGLAVPVGRGGYDHMSPAPGAGPADGEDGS